MSSVFSKIIAGELPARSVFSDARCVAFLTIAPLRPGHTLVVPREEIDQWTDLPPELAAHVFGVAKRIGTALKQAFGSARAGLVIAGDEVPHAHLHVVPFDGIADLDFRRIDHHPDPAALDDAAERIRAALS